MGATLFKKVDYSLSKLIHDIDHGEIGLPDIQRPFVWGSAKVRDLFDSMYKGFPVGYLLFWSNEHLSDNRQIGTDEKQSKIPRLLIVDGQQRLTSLYAVLTGHSIRSKDYTENQIRIAFRPRDAKFDVTDAAIERDPEFIANITELWAGESSRNRFVKEFLSRLAESRNITDDDEDMLSESIDRLYDVQNYPFTAMEISSTVDEEQVSEIFVRVNSKGVTLNQGDFILTLLSVFWDQGRSELEEFCFECRQPPSNSKPSPFNHFIQPDPDQMLRACVGLGFKRARLQHVYSILRGKDLDTGEFSTERRDSQFEVLKDAQTNALNLTDWHEFLKALVQAGFRSKNMITSELGLIYAYVMFLMGRHEFGLEYYDLKNVIARWFYMISLTRRYTGSPETVMESDLARLRNVRDGGQFIDELNRLIEASFTEDYWNITLPNELETSSARTPVLFAYFAALNLLDARVLFSPLKVSELLDPVINPKKASLDRHHLFPRGYLKSIGITEIRDVNQVANYALVQWDDNIAISDHPPADYYPAYASRMLEEELWKMLDWHALPDGWEHMDYFEFLEHRRKLMAQVIRAGFDRLI